MPDEATTLPTADAAPEPPAPVAQDVPASDQPDGGGAASTAEQDSWLHRTLGLDLGSYAAGAVTALGDAASTLATGVRDAAAAAIEGGGALPATDDADTGGGGPGGGGPGGGGFGARLADAASSLVDTAKAAVRTVVEGGTAVADGVGAFLSRPAPVPRADLGPAQTARADKKLQAMPPDEQAKVKALLDGVSPDERKYLQKALASNHTAAEIEAFYQEIQGKDAAWMDQNLHLTGQPDGTGIKQQWKDSCGPTTVQAMKGELDPVYALKLRQQNQDVADVDDDHATAINPEMAEEQRNMLEYHHGIAVDRDSNEAGKGMILDDALKAQESATGLNFDCQSVNKDNVDAELTEIDRSVGAGLPVPLRLGDNRGGHFVLITGADAGPPRRYAIHDPWNGKLVTVTDEQIRKGTFDVANYSRITHVYKPSPVPDQAAP